MTRFSPLSILKQHWSGMADHRNHSGGKADWAARIPLVLIPFGCAGTVFWRNWDMSRQAANLLAAGALLAALMLAIFVQLAAWRSRLDDRAFTNLEKEAPTRRAVDEAAAHSLVGGLASIVVTAATVLAGIVGHNRLVSGVIVGVGAYLALLLLIIFHMAWVAYWSMTDGDLRQQDRRLLEPEPDEARVIVEPLPLSSSSDDGRS